MSQIPAVVVDGVVATQLDPLDRSAATIESHQHRLLPAERTQHNALLRSRGFGWLRFGRRGLDLGRGLDLRRGLCRLLRALLFALLWIRISRRFGHWLGRRRREEPESRSDAPAPQEERQR